MSFAVPWKWPPHKPSGAPNPRGLLVDFGRFPVSRSRRLRPLCSHWLIWCMYSPRHCLRSLCRDRPEPRHLKKNVVTLHKNYSHTCPEPLSPLFVPILFSGATSASSSSMPNICHRRCTWPNGRSLPKMVAAASYLFSGLRTSSHSHRYVLTRRANPALWTLLAKLCMDSCASRGG